MSEFLTVTGNDEHRKSDVCLIVQHDGQGDNIFQRFKELPGAIAVGAGTFKEYLQLEQDTGSTELAVEISDLLRKQGVIAEVVKANIPRGLIDPNAPSSRTVRNVLQRDKRGVLLSKIMVSHAIIMDGIRQRIKALAPNGLVIDLHTMASCDIPANERVWETPANLRDYISSFEFKPDSKRRVINVATSIAGDPIKDGGNWPNTVIANKPLTLAIQTSLSEQGYEWHENYPNFIEKDRRSAEYIEGKGVTIHVPKYLLRDDDEDNNDGIMAVDPDRVARLAEAIAAGIIHVKTPES